MPEIVLKAASWVPLASRYQVVTATFWVWLLPWGVLLVTVVGVDYSETDGRCRSGRLASRKTTNSAGLTAAMPISVVTRPASMFSLGLVSSLHLT